MTARGTALAAAGSVLAHVAVLGGLAVVLTPAPPPDQPHAETRVSIATQQVRQTAAAPGDTTGDAAPTGEPEVTAARQGTARQTTATATALPVQRVVAATAAAPVMRATQTTMPVTPPIAPLGPAVAAAAPDALTLKAAPPVALDAKAAPVTALPVAASRPPKTSDATSQTLPMTVLPEKPLPAQVQTAALAWSGGGDSTVSALSLAAIAAFSEQGDMTGAAQDVRDGITGILSSVPCARLQTVFDPDTGTMTLTGHIPEDALRSPVLDALRAEVGDAIPVSDNLLILPRPQCGALSAIAAIDLPQSTEQLTNPRVIGADGSARNYTYADGQSLQLDLIGPDYDSVVYVDYFTADGDVIHLQPNTVVPLQPLDAKTPLTVGRDSGDGPYLNLTVGPPYGQEIAAAFATSVPLYDGLRPVQEPADAYLSFLKDRVAAARAAHPDFKGEWVYFFITTTAD